MLERGKISSLQLTILITGFVLGSSTILIPASRAGHDNWLAILLGLGEGLFFTMVYLFVLLKFPNKNLVQINDIIFGSYLGKLMSILYIWYFLHLGSLVLRNFGDFFSVMMPETPMPVFIITIALVCAWAVRCGVEVIARCALVLVPLVMIIIISTALLLLNKMDLSNFLPIIDGDLMNFILAINSAATFPFGETIVFTTIIFTLNNTQKAKISVFGGLIIAGLLLTLTAIRNTAVLGDTKIISTYPSFDAVRLIAVGDIFNRLEIIVAIDFLTMGFLKICVLYYAVVLSLAQLTKLKTYGPIINPMGIILIGLSIYQFDNVIENIDFAYNIYPFYSLFFQFVLPLLSLFLILLRKGMLNR